MPMAPERLEGSLFVFRLKLGERLIHFVSRARVYPASP